MKKNITKTLTATLSLALAGVFACGCGLLSACTSDKKNDGDGEKRITSVSTTGFDHFYTPGSEIDIDSLSVVVTYSDSTSKTLTEKLIDPEEDEGELEVYSVEDDDTSYTDAEEGETPEDYGEDTEEEETGSDDETPAEKSIFDGGAEFALYTDGLYACLSSGRAAEGEYAFSCLLAEDMNTYDLGTVYIGEDITHFDVTLYEDPDFITEYEANLERCGDKEDDNEYVKETEEYCVGDDNGFVFVPKLTLSDPHNKKLSFDQSVFDVDVSVYYEDEETGETVELNLEDNLYVEYADFSFDFTDVALGKLFTIEMELSDFDRDFAGLPLSPVTMTVRVCDGYNVYDALDLGHMNLVDSDPGYDNYVDQLSKPVFWDNGSYVQIHTFDVWKDFLKGKGEPEDSLKATNGIFLHRDIDITSDDIPEDFFVGEEEAERNGVAYDDMIGCVRDSVYLYTHYMTDDFTLNGNLFTIDCSTLKYGLTSRKSSGLKYYPEGDTAVATSNSALFEFCGRKDNSKDWTKVDDSTRCLATMENVEIVGNMSNPNYKVSGKENGMAAGSLMMVESASSRLKTDNLICREFVMAIYTNNSNTRYTASEIDNTKVFDCYNCGLYVYISANNYVKNSVFKRIGGPIVMCTSKTKMDNEHDDNYGYFFEAGCEFDEDTILENYIAGDEAWFVSMDVTFIPVLLAWFDEFFERIGKTLYTGVSTSVGASGEQVEASAVNLHFVAVDNGVGSSSDASKYLNCHFVYGDDEYMLSEDTYTKSELSNPDNFASTAEYNSGLSNYFMDHTNGYIGMYLIFSTNTGKIFTVNSDTMAGGYPFYELAPYALESKSVQQELDESDT
ncbi:MAG: hypothetical protein LUD47_00640, partial [Clostridia bacterium]|nr:hypothetical protein [Clostridia bacterium]